MSTMLKAGKALEHVTTTTAASLYASDTTLSDTRYRARSRGSISGEFVIGKLSMPMSAEDSTWGWSNFHRFSAAQGWPCEVLETQPPLDDE